MKWNTRLVLNDDVDVNTVSSCIEKAANKHLKLRPNKDGKGVVTVERVDRGKYNLRIPYDARYKQKQDALDKFNSEWSRALYNRSGVQSGHMSDLKS